MNLTPHVLTASYDCLREFPPFKGWKLPHSDEIEFNVLSSNGSTIAHYNRYKYTDRHIIGISGNKVGHFYTLSMAMAHEMLHLFQAIRKSETANTEHNAEFIKLSKRICKLLGFDEKAF